MNSGRFVVQGVTTVKLEVFLKENANIMSSK